MKRFRLGWVWGSVALTLALVCCYAGAQTNIAGILYASNFAKWQVPAGNNGNYQWSSGSVCRVSSNGATFEAFRVGTPVRIVDMAVPAQSETVVPTAVSHLGGSCGLTINPVYPHVSFYLTSATAGLQESINTTGASATANSAPAVVTLTPDWTVAGGTTAMVLAAVGNTNVSIFDQRTAVPAAYVWTVTGGVGAYVLVPLGGGGGGTTTLTGPVTGSGAGTVPTAIANSGVTPGTYNFGSQVLTIGADGRVTAAGTPFTATFGCTPCGNYETGYAGITSASGTIEYANPALPTSASVTDGTNVVALVSPFTSWTESHAYTSNTTFTLTAVGNGQTVTQQAGIGFYPRTFSGAGTAGATGATAAGTNAALAGASGTLASAGLGNQATYACTAAGQKCYVLMLGGGHTFTSGGFSFPMNAPTAVTFVNQYGASVGMFVYESTNLLGSAGSPASFPLVVASFLLLPWLRRRRGLRVVSLLLAAVPAVAQVKLGGHVSVPSSTDSPLGQTSVVLLQDADCDVLNPGATCTVTANADPGNGSAGYNGTFYVTSMVPLTAVRKVIVPPTPGRCIAVDNHAQGAQGLLVTGATGAGAVVGAGTAAQLVCSTRGVDYALMGTAPAGTNAVQASNPAGTGNVVATAAQIAQPVVAAVQAAAQSQHGIYGDSIAEGVGPLNSEGLYDPGLGFANVLAQYIGGVYQAYANSGDACYDTSNVINSTATPSSGSVYIADSSFTNDTSEFNANANNLKMGQRCLLGNYYRLLMPDSAKNFLQGATLAGGFALDGNTYKSGQGVVSTSVGASMSQVVTVGSSGVIVGCYQAISGNGANFNLAANSVLQTDPIGGSTLWTAGGDGGQAITTAHGATQFCAGFRLTGFTPGAAVTVTFTQQAAGTLNVQWLGSPSVSATNPYLFAMDVPELGGNSNTSLYQTVFTNGTGYMATDGLNIKTIGARAVLGPNPGTLGYWKSDQTHPTYLGTAQINNISEPLASSTGVVTAPSYTANLANVGVVPSTSDVTKGSTLNPTGSIDGTSQGWIGLISHTRNAQGGLEWEGDAYSPIATGHIYGQTQNAQAYSWCYWAKNADAYNFIYLPSAVLGCDAQARGGQWWMGVNAAGQPAEIVAPNTVVVGYYPGTVGTHILSANTTAVTPAEAIARVPGVNYSSPIFSMRSLSGSDSSAFCVGAAWQMVVPSSGINQPGVLKLVNDVNCHGLGDYALPFSLDLTGAAAVNIGKAQATDENGIQNVCLGDGRSCYVGSYQGSASVASVAAGSCTLVTVSMVSSIGAPATLSGSKVVSASAASNPGLGVTLTSYVASGSTAGVNVCALTGASNAFTVNVVQ